MPYPLLVAVFGHKKSGKTLVIETLIRALRRRGLKVGAVKHVHHANFTIDQEGKDSWRFTTAGARRVVIISPSEVAMIDKRVPRMAFEEISDFFSGEEFDVVLLEGFLSNLARDRRIFKLIAGSTSEDVGRILEECEPPILGVVTIDPRSRITCSSTRVYIFNNQSEELADLIAELVSKRGSGGDGRPRGAD